MRRSGEKTASGNRALSRTSRYAGFDWAHDHHEVVIVNRSGKIVADFQIEHTAEGWQRWLPVWPIQLGFMDLARVLFAWCERKQAFRFFRTDRLVSAADGDRYPARRVDLIRRCQDDMKIAEAAVQAPDRN